MADLDKTIDGFAFWIKNEENGVCYVPLNLCEKIMKLLKEQEARIKKFELEKSWDESPDMMGKW